MAIAQQWLSYTSTECACEPDWPSVRKSNERSGSNGMASPSLTVLETEIADLRKQMELIFCEMQSFTSEAVIEISRLLDLKINQYYMICEQLEK